jgi:hypothetical protein
MEKCPWRGTVCDLRVGLAEMEDDEETVSERKKRVQMVDTHVDELMENVGVEILCAEEEILCDEVEILCDDEETLSEWKIYVSDTGVSICAALEKERHVEVTSSGGDVQHVSLSRGKPAKEPYAVHSLPDDAQGHQQYPGKKGD